MGVFSDNHKSILLTSRLQEARHGAHKLLCAQKDSVLNMHGVVSHECVDSGADDPGADG